MKLGKLIELLNLCEGYLGSETEVSIETGDTKNGRRIENKLFDVLRSNRILLVGKEANDLDPINSIPVVDNDGDEIPEEFN